MSGFGSNYGQRVRLSPSLQKPSPPTTTYENYTPPETTTPTGITDQMDYLKNMQVGYTPEQELAMRNRIRATDTAQTTGGMNRMSEMMAARGLGGSGYESSAMGGMLRGQNAARQGALSNLDISNAGLANQNIYQKGGMLNQLTGMGETARQFDRGQDSNMYQYGTSFDEGKRQYDQQRNDYMKQLQDMLRMYGMGGSSISSGGGMSGTPLQTSRNW